MEKIKIRNTKNKVVKEVEKNFAGDYLGTKEWEMVKEETKKSFIAKDNDNKEEK